jgi:hypothetical protein
MIDERKVKQAFTLVKNDMINLQRELLELNIRQQRIMEMLSKLNNKTIRTSIKPKVKIKTVTKRAKKVFVASKTGKKFHDKHCPFAKNIKPKSKVIFKTKNTALNHGLKPCTCVK